MQFIQPKIARVPVCFSKINVFHGIVHTLLHKQTIRIKSCSIMSDIDTFINSLVEKIIKRIQ